MAAREGELDRSWLGAKEGNRCVMQQGLCEPGKGGQFHVVISRSKDQSLVGFYFHVIISKVAIEELRITEFIFLGIITSMIP